jgi:hypothetical protein
MVKIYALKDPLTGFVRYVGKTNRNELDRLSEHICDAKRKKGHKENWIKKLINENQKPIIEILKLVEENEWEFWEKFFIEKFNKEQKIKLVNIESGGNGTGKVSLKTKKILQEKNKQKKSIQVFKLNNELCGTYLSISECVRLFFEIDKSIDSKLFKKYHSVISRICSGKNNSYLGYKFIFFLWRHRFKY